MTNMSPMMKQYFDIKAKHKDTILFFRLGDFYEMFFDDAKLASDELDLTLTGRDCGQDKKAPMCGVPYHSCESYISRLVSKGYKIAICEQMEEPSKGKGIVKRDVVRVITPGTIVESSMLDESRNNYICSLFVEEESAGICFCDVSTGELKTTEFINGDLVLQIKNELGKFCPREVLAGGNTAVLNVLSKFIKEKISCSVEKLSDEKFEINQCKSLLMSELGLKKFNGSQIVDKQLCLRAIGALFLYLKQTQKIGLERIDKIEFYKEHQYMGLDLNTIRNLELVETMRNKEKRGSLLWVLDKTKTAMGKRLLRSWIERPLRKYDEIIKRQQAVEELYSDVILRDNLKELFIGVHDIERLMTKITYGSANGRDLRSLFATISQIPGIKNILKDCKSEMLSDIRDNIDILEDVKTLINDAIVEDPPFSVREGGMIKDGYNSEIDEVRGDMTGGTSIVTEIELRERKNTGIPKLKVGYNRVFGYYIEVSNSYKNLVPESYVRKQTLDNCERYITKELKAIESRILGAKDRVVQLEYKVFEGVRLEVSKSLSRIETTAKMLAKLDVLRSLAEVSSRNNYIKPEIRTDKSIIIREGRHPVVELLLDGAPFVPNNALFDDGENSVAIITGPNMAGKSTYMRQVALIVLMAQIGSFVPAAYARVGLVDSIFTRIGASDDLASGQSTFMVEMNEVAQIVKNATCDSLLILDEIGRGTSTFDGMSIARAVLEYVADKTKLGAKTLFATHYHELTEMAEMYKGMKNYNIAVKKRGDEITFLRRIVPGGADESYGIEVAKLAGIPEWIISRAKQIISELELGEKSGCKKEKCDEESCVASQENSCDEKYKKVIDELKNMDVSVLTPIESMNKLFELVKTVNA